MPTESFVAVLKALHEHEVEYILIGGLAVILHAPERPSRCFLVERKIAGEKIMPVYKYRSLQEAEAHLNQLLPSDPIERLKRLEKLLAGLKPRPMIQRGLFKFKTLEEANQHRKDTMGA